MVVDHTVSRLAIGSQDFYAIESEDNDFSQESLGVGNLLLAEHIIHRLRDHMQGGHNLLHARTFL